MPEQLHPPYNITQPRTLVRWLDVNSQNGTLNRTRYTVTVPAYNIGGFNYQSSPFIVGLFQYNSPNNFSLQDLSQLTSPAIFNNGQRIDTLAISYVNKDNTVFRRVLAAGQGDRLLEFFPQYNGEMIRRAFMIEIWCADSGGQFGEASQGLPTTMTTSVLNRTVDYRYGLDSDICQPGPLITNLATPNLNLPFVFNFQPVLNS